MQRPTGRSSKNRSNNLNTTLKRSVFTPAQPLRAETRSSRALFSVRHNPQRTPEGTPPVLHSLRPCLGQGASRRARVGRVISLAFLSILCAKTGQPHTDLISPLHFGKTIFRDWSNQLCFDFNIQRDRVVQRQATTPSLPTPPFFILIPDTFL
jgi:hypothetical protein